MNIGYARVSTADQNLSLQRDALHKAECFRIFEDTGSGGKTDRPQLKACLDSLRKDDTLIVWKLDRLGRSLIDLVHIMRDLETLGVQFLSLTENIDTKTPVGKFIFHVFALLAEFEHDRIRERTKAGLEAARARGRKGGAKTKTTSGQRRQIRALHTSRQFTIGEIAHQFRISKPTVHRIVLSKD